MAWRMAVGYVDEEQRAHPVSPWLGRLARRTMVMNEYSKSFMFAGPAGEELGLDGPFIYCRGAVSAVPGYEGVIASWSWMRQHAPRRGTRLLSP